MTFSQKIITDAVCAARVLVLVLLPAFLGAATYYGSPSGTDTNPGTYAQPFRTVARGIQAASAGDTIILQCKV